MYQYIFKEGKVGKPVFILLHGTGADEENLLPIADFLDSEATVLSIRGNVSENGMNRYFKRHAEGQYDVEDLMKRGEELYDFIIQKSKEYNFSLADAVYVGFSNGSNIAINMLLESGTEVNKAILYAPMYPVEVKDSLDLSETNIFLSMGEQDPIVPISESQRVIDLFENKNAEVTEFWVHSHELNEQNLLASKKWLESLDQ